MRLACPSCRTVIHVRDEHAGKLCRCPSCRTPTRVPPRRRHTLLFLSAGGAALAICLVALLFQIPKPAPAPAAPPPVDPEAPRQNGADLYREGARILPSIPKIVEDYAAADREKLAKALRDLEPALAHFEKASQASRCEWEYKDLWMGAELPHVAPGIRAAKALSARARLRAERKDAEGAMRDLSTLLKIGSDYLLDKTLVGQLVGVVAVGIAVDTFQCSLLRSPLESSLLRSLEAHVKPLIDRFPTFERTIECEKASSIATVKYLIDPAPPHSFSEALVQLGRAGDDPLFDTIDAVVESDLEGARRVFERRVEELYDLAGRDGKEPLYSRTAHLDVERLRGEAEKELAEYGSGKREDRAKAQQAAADVLCAVLVPPVMRGKRNFASGLLSLHALRTWCRLELHRRENGKYPKDLAEIGSAPPDAWDGGVLKYVLTEKGFVLTSAGPKGDWKERARVLIEDCRFDMETFRAKSAEYEETAAWTLWGVSGT